MPLSLAVPRHQADTVSATHGGDRPRACGEQQQSGDNTLLLLWSRVPCCLVHGPLSGEQTRLGVSLPRGTGPKGFPHPASTLHTALPEHGMGAGVGGGWGARW